MDKILVIEDEKDCLNNICKILELEGYETLKAENGAVGVVMARDHQPDLILCDIAMPKKSGYEVIKEVKDDSKTSNIPFIFLTVYSDEDNIVKGFDLGAQDYISKSSDNKVLLARIRTHLELGKKNKLLQRIIYDLYGRLEKLEREKDSLEKQMNALKLDKEMQLKEKELLISRLDGNIECLYDVIKCLKENL